mgnify:CR=1 FL=1
MSDPVLFDARELERDDFGFNVPNDPLRTVLLARAKATPDYWMDGLSSRPELRSRRAHCQALCHDSVEWSSGQ